MYLFPLIVLYKPYANEILITIETQKYTLKFQMMMRANIRYTVRFETAQACGSFHLYPLLPWPSPPPFHFTINAINKTQQESTSSKGRTKSFYTGHQGKKEKKRFINIPKAENWIVLSSFVFLSLSYKMIP